MPVSCSSFIGKSELNIIYTRENPPYQTETTFQRINGYHGNLWFWSNGYRVKKQERVDSHLQGEKNRKKETYEGDFKDITGLQNYSNKRKKRKKTQ